MDSSRSDNQVYELEAAFQVLRRSHFSRDDHSGLRNAERHILFLVANLSAGKPVMPSEIAKKIGVTLAAITHQLNSLEEQGLIQRFASDEDRRVLLVSLSGHGEEKVKTLKKGYREKLSKLTRYLGKEDTAQLIKLIKRMTDFFAQTEEAKEEGA